MKRCVVLGGDGFIGAHLCKALLAAGHGVVAFDISREFPSLRTLDDERLQRMTGDFLDRSAVREALRGAQWVFHLVSTTLPASSNSNMTFDVQTNVVASIGLLEECVEQGVEKLLFASSGGTVYGAPASNPVPEDAPTNPVVSYGVTKLAIEKYCHLFRYQHNLHSVCLRIANPFGPGHHGMMQGVIPVFLKRLLAGQTLTIWGDGSVVRDYVFVSDVADAFVRAAAYPGPEQIFNIGSGQGVSLKALLQTLEVVVERPVPVIFEAARRFDVPEIVLDIGLARQALAWQPQVALEEGIRQTWEALGQEGTS